MRPAEPCRWCSAKSRFSLALQVHAQDSERWHIYRWDTGTLQFSEQTRWQCSGRLGCGGHSRSTGCEHRGAEAGLQRAPGRLGRSALTPESPSCSEKARQDETQRRRNPDEPFGLLQHGKRRQSVERREREKKWRQREGGFVIKWCETA